MGQLGGRMSIGRFVLILIAVGITRPDPVAAQRATAYLKREVGKGYGKQCIYEYGGKLHSRTPRQTDRSGLNQAGVVDPTCEYSIEIWLPKPKKGALSKESKDSSDTDTQRVTAIKTGEREYIMSRECLYVSTKDSTVTFMRVIPLKSKCAPSILAVPGDP
jgi:hypothetical protein